MTLITSSVYVDAAVALVVISITLYWYFTRNFDYWKKRNIPYVEPLPLFGNLKDTVLFRKSPNQVFQDIYNKLEGHKYGGMFQSGTPALVIRDPEIIKIITVKDFPYFQDRGLRPDPKVNPLAQHLFAIGGAEWKHLRVKLSPTFTSGKMKLMFKVMEECSKSLQQYLAEPAAKEEILEFKEIFAKFTTDVIGTCAFGLQMNALENPDSEFREMGRKVIAGTFRNAMNRLLFVFFPKIAALLKIPLLDPEITNFFLNVVKETVDYREKNNIHRNDFLQLLIELKKKGKLEDDEHDQDDNIYNKDMDKLKEEHIEMDDAMLAAQAFVFFLAGFETSSTTMSFAIHELAVNPDVQEKLRQEVDAALEETGGKFTYDAIMNMKYMDKVVSETLRKYPPVGTLIREVTIPYTLPGTSVKLSKGTKVFIPSYALHHDPKYFPQPDKFDPERFSEEARAARPNYVYLPFGEGPRNCIGMRFGLLQSKMGLAALLAKYQFHVCERTEEPQRLNPRSGITASFAGTILRITNRP